MAAAGSDSDESLDPDSGHGTGVRRRRRFEDEEDLIEVDTVRDWFLKRGKRGLATWTLRDIGGWVRPKHPPPIPSSWTMAEDYDVVTTFKHIIKSKRGDIDISTIRRMIYKIKEDDDWQSILNELFIDAVDANNLIIANELIRDGADRHVFADTAAQHAAETGHLEMLKLVFENEEIVFLPYVEIDFLMIDAAVNGHLNIVRYLIEKKGADPHALEDIAARWAFVHDEDEVVQYFVDEHGFDLEMVNEPPGIRMRNRFVRYADIEEAMQRF
jgi:hypothetical protein